MDQEPDFVTTGSGQSDSDPTDPARIERDIERTRAEMSETIDALGARFEPAYIKEQAQEALRDTARSAGTSMIDTLRDNPLPSAIAGLSIAWLFANRSPGHSGRDRYEPMRGRSAASYDRAGTYAGRRFPAESAGIYAGGATPVRRDDDGPSLTDRAGDLADHARDRAGEMADQARDRAAHLGDQAHDVQRQAVTWFEDQMNRNPLGVGAVALAAGALVGLSVPSTEAEANFMGEPASRMVSQVKDVAEERLGQVREAVDHVMSEAKEKVSEVTETAKTEAKHVAESPKPSGASSQNDPLTRPVGRG